ncbi:MAG TPA: phosphate ABC transporter permease PstA [Candidatus Methylacidiphilales bacterium]|jgi:phosphate transport system permease protein|nr:phosphate ABC transporter permease PstA [Candidatus Methylacidiphilales bacterium]
MDLSRKPRVRLIFSRAMDIAVGFVTLAALVPLASVLYMVVRKGAGNLRWSMLWELPPAAGMDGGGFGNALVGTLLMVAIGAAVSVPTGILTAIFLTEYSLGSKSARLIRFCAKILSGLPSILAGVFVFGVLVINRDLHLWGWNFGGFSAIAGGGALGILMLPIVILSAEEALLRVPRFLREASLALGANRTQTVLHITLPAAISTIITGVMLAVARAAGETAPILFTALFTSYWISSLHEPTASMAVLIYNFSSVPYDNMVNMAWSASFVLIFIVLVTNIVSHLVANRSK